MIINFGSMGNDFLVPSGMHLPARGETIVSKESFVLTPGGGKGMNQAVAAARAGAKVKMAGMVGRDGYGDAVLDTLKKEGVDISLIKVSDKAKTGVAFIFVSKDGSNSIINSAGANLVAKESDIPDAFLNKDAILMLQMEVDHAENWKLVKRARKNGARIVLNVAPADTVPAEVLKDLDYLIVNEIEAQQIAKVLKLELKGGDYAALAKAIAESCDLSCIITLGENGVVAFSEGRSYKVLALALDKVVDTTGAGDAFCGGFTASIDKGYSFEESLQRGCVTGGLACTAIGCQTALPMESEIDRYMARSAKRAAG